MSNKIQFTNNEFNKLYPNAALFKTGKSAFDIQYDNAQKEAFGKHGISFYSPKFDKYIFIENTHEGRELI